MPLSRRAFLSQCTGLTFCLALQPPAHAAEARAPAPRTSMPLNAYVHIRSDDSILIYYPSAEMGQGVMTALPLIVAEELDADWERVEVAPSPPVGEAYGDPVFINLIFTVSSRAIAAYFERLRLFGAQARRVLLYNAAAHWRVPLAELHTEPSRVVHGPSGRTLTYGALAALPGLRTEVPALEPADLKAPERFRLIGQDLEPRALAHKLNGTFQYSIDVDPPGLLHAAVVRAAVPRTQISRCNEERARAAPGVLGVFRGEDRVAVVARSYYQALQAKRLLQIDWTGAPAAQALHSEALLQRSAQAARALSTAGIPWDRAGEPEARFGAQARVLEREYQTDYMYHGGLEPMNAAVAVAADGQSADVWAGTQAPKYTLDKVAEITGVDPSRVTLHRCPMGGAFGRRSVYAMDFVQDAAWLAARLRQPVKVIWDREEDFKLGYLRPMSGQFIRAALREDGMIAAWHHRVACEDPVKEHEPLLWQAWHEAPLIGMLGSEHRAEEGPELLHAYDFPDRLVEYLPVEAGVRVYAMRGVGAMPNKFAIESFLDEAAAQTQRDPLAYRLALLHRSERARRVLETVAQMSAWARPRQGRGLGVAYSHYAGSLIACVVEVSVEPASGQIHLHEVWVAVDPGLIIQPDNLRAQIEGGVLYGLSNALMERITLENGRIQQSNFIDYPLMRMPTAPPVHVQLIKSLEPPSGVGEIGTVVAPPALANAFAALTGQRLRQLPLTPERVRALLA